MTYGSGFLRHGRLDRVGTLSEASCDKKKLKGGRGKGTAVQGISWRCKNNQHSQCTSMTCKCDCGHLAKNKI